MESYSAELQVMQQEEDARKQQMLDETKLQASSDVQSIVQSLDKTNSNWTPIIQLKKDAEFLKLNNDPQIRKFYDFICIGTNFASVDFASRIKQIPDLVGSIKDLIDEIQKEIREFADLAVELQEITNFFNKVVIDTKHKAGMVIPYLEATKHNIKVLDDVLKKETFTDVDIGDVKVALSGVLEGTGKLHELAVKQKSESEKINSNIEKMKDDMVRRKMISEGRLELASNAYIEVSSVFAGAFGFGFLGGAACVVYPAAIDAIGFTPAGLIVLSAMVGGVACGLLMSFVSKLFARHQKKAIMYLTRMLHALQDLSERNLEFLCYMNSALETTTALSSNTDEIQKCLESERRRKLNKDICFASIQNVNEMIFSLNKVRNISLQIKSPNEVLAIKGSS